MKKYLKLINLVLISELFMCGMIAWKLDLISGMVFSLIFIKLDWLDRMDRKLYQMIVDLMKLSDLQNEKINRLKDETFRMHADTTELIADLTINKIDLSGDKIEKSLSSKN